MNPPMHGAATTPTKSPIPNAPAPPARAPARFMSDVGMRISQTPNIESAITTSAAAIALNTHGFWSIEPNRRPERAAPTPSAEYIVAIPRT